MRMRFSVHTGYNLDRYRMDSVACAFLRLHFARSVDRT
jgi:hypothetical protein